MEDQAINETLGEVNSMEEVVVFQYLGYRVIPLETGWNLEKG